MFQADKKFKGDLHKSPQSIELSNRIKNLSYWRLVVSQLLTKVSHVERLSTLTKKLLPSYIMIISTMTGAYSKRRTACKKLRKHISRSSRLRRKHLIARDAVFELNDEQKQGKVIKQLITIDHQCSLHATIKYKSKPTTKSRLSKIKIPVDNENWNNIRREK